MLGFLLTTLIFIVSLVGFSKILDVLNTFSASTPNFPYFATKSFAWDFISPICEFVNPVSLRKSSAASSNLVNDAKKIQSNYLRDSIGILIHINRKEDEARGHAFAFYTCNNIN